MAVITSITTAYVHRGLPGCGRAVVAGYAASGNGCMLHGSRDPGRSCMTVGTGIIAQYVIDRFGRRVNLTTDTMTAYTVR